MFSVGYKWKNLFSKKKKKRKRKKIKKLSPQEKAAKTRKQNRIVVELLTLLAVDLTISAINNGIISLEKYMNRFLVTAIGMVLSVILLFFMINLINELGHKFFTKTIKSDIPKVQSRKLGLFIVSLVSLSMLYFAYYWVWFVI